MYDEYFDDGICPEYRALHYSTTNREGYREYKSRAYLCKACPTRGMCTESAKSEKTVLRHVWQDYVEMAEHVRHMAVYKELYRPVSYTHLDVYKRQASERFVAVTRRMP